MKRIKSILRPIYINCVCPVLRGDLVDHFSSFIYYIYNYWITNFPIHWVRLFYLRKFMLIEIGHKSFIHMGCLFYHGVKIGNHSVIGRECHLLGNIVIKDNVSITAQAYIFAASHYANSKIFEAYYKQVVIDDYAWVGARAIIQPGVHVGVGAILGAGAVATKSIPPYEIFAGIPAKKIGVRDPDMNYTLNYSPYFQ